MPNIEHFQNINKRLNKLGDEQNILSKKGETIPTVNLSPLQSIEKKQSVRNLNQLELEELNNLNNDILNKTSPTAPDANTETPIDDINTTPDETPFATDSEPDDTRADETIIDLESDEPDIPINDISTTPDETLFAADSEPDDTITDETIIDLESDEPDIPINDISTTPDETPFAADSEPDDTRADETIIDLESDEPDIPINDISTTPDETPFATDSEPDDTRADDAVIDLESDEPNIPINDISTTPDETPFAADSEPDDTRADDAVSNEEFDNSPDANTETPPIDDVSTTPDETPFAIDNEPNDNQQIASLDSIFDDDILEPLEFNEPQSNDISNIFDIENDTNEDLITSISSLEDIPDLDFNPDSFLDTELPEEFSIAGFEEVFGIFNDNIQDEIDEDEQQATNIKELSEYEETFVISKDDFNKFQKNLALLPYQLKVAIEETLVNNQYQTMQVQPLIYGIINNDTPVVLAKKLFRITNIKIDIPKHYTKYSGQLLSTYQDSFSYRFWNQIFPIIRLITVGFIISIILLYLSYEYLYKPLLSNYLYEKGLAEIENGNYNNGNHQFTLAYNVMPDNDRFIEYATAFTNKHQYLLAKNKYEMLLGPLGEEEARAIFLQPHIDPNHKNGIIAYAQFLNNDYYMPDYQNFINAQTYLKRIIRKNRYDYETLLTSGDGYLSWAKFITDERFEYPIDELFEKARVQYATLISKNGNTPELLQRMLLYFVRTDNKKDAHIIRLAYEQNKELFEENDGINVDILTEYAGYLITRAENSTQEAIKGRDLLQDMLKYRPNMPDIHYYLGRYYNLIEDNKNEMRALNITHDLFTALREKELFSRLYNRMYIYTLNRLGELHLNQDSFTARTYFNEAINIYEQTLTNNAIFPDKNFGKIYYNLAEIYYYKENNYPLALSYYHSAENNLFSTRDIFYKKGFIYYIQNNFIKAKLNFIEAESSIPTANNNLLWAQGNTLYKLGNYTEAIAKYRFLMRNLDLMRNNLNSFQAALNSIDWLLANFQVNTANNLGIAYIKSYYQNQYNQEYLRLGQSYLQLATEKRTNLTRDPFSQQRALNIPLSSLNQKNVLYDDIDGINIYSSLYKDLHSETL